MKRIAEFARRHGGVNVPEIRVPEQPECVGTTSRRRRQLVRDRGHGIGHALILPTREG
jgi:hypothetical protein